MDRTTRSDKNATQQGSLRHDIGPQDKHHAIGYALDSDHVLVVGVTPTADMVKALNDAGATFLLTVDEQSLPTPRPDAAGTKYYAAMRDVLQRLAAKRLFEQVDAQTRLANKRRRHLVAELATNGLTQQEVAAAASISQAQVSRILASNDPELGTPADVIDQRDAGEITDDEMLRLLIDMRYTYDAHPGNGNILLDAILEGTWREIEQAFADDRITYRQYASIVAAHRDELKKAAAAT